MVPRIATVSLLSLVATALVPAGTAIAEGFGVPRRWHGDFAAREATETPATGDFDGDGKADLVVVASDTGDVHVARSNGSGFGAAERWLRGFSRVDDRTLVGNVDGAGGDDLVVFRRGEVVVARSRGRRFGAPVRWHDELASSSDVPLLGDVDGDGLDDVIVFTGGAVRVARSTGRGFAPAVTWHDHFASGGEVPRVGDFNGDGKADLASFVRSARDGDAYGDVNVALSTGGRFGVSRVWNVYFGQQSELAFIADVDADGCDDILVAVRDTWGGPGRGNIYVASADCGPGYAFLATRLWHTDFAVTEDTRAGAVHEDAVATGDVDGDGLVDLVAFSQGGAAGTGRGDVRVALNADPTPEEPGRTFALDGAGACVFIDHEPLRFYDRRRDPRARLTLDRDDLRRAAGKGEYTLSWPDGSDAEIVYEVAPAAGAGRFAVRWTWHSFDVKRPASRMSADERACQAAFQASSM